MRLRTRAAGVIGIAVALAGLLTLTGARLAAPQGTRLVALETTAKVPVQEPFDPFWNDIPRVEVPLSAQQVTPPMGGHRWTLWARAIHDSENVYVMAEWDDPRPNRSTSATQDFTDSVALEFPAVASETVPALCMGDPAANVNIWQWKAAYQEQIHRGYEGIKGRYPNTAVDWYPFHGEKTFYPGRATGNPVSSNARTSAVDNLIAAGFGTLTPDPDSTVTGWGAWRDGRWRVVFQRPMMASGEGNVNLPVDARTSMAFAVWDGGAQERDGMKSVGNFVSLDVSSKAMPAPVQFPYWPAPYFVVLAVFALLVWLVIARGSKEAGE